MMEFMGIPGNTWRGYQPHHIIPGEHRSHPVLKKMGIDLDHHTNGEFLPSTKKQLYARPKHRGYHSVYNEAVGEALDRIDADLPIDELVREVHALRERLRAGIRAGMPLYRSQGATRQMWQRWIGGKR